MVIQHKDGKRTTSEVGDGVRGLRLLSVTLDSVDIHNLVELARNDKLGGFVYALSCEARAFY
jgi:hypothetical protein